MLIYAVFLVLAIVTSAEVTELSDVSEVVDDQGQQACAESDWVLISHPKDVCFEAQGNRYGSFLNFVRGGLITAIKLVYVSGKVSCVGQERYDSRWGCHNYPSYKDYPLNVIITDDKNHILFPKPDFINTVYPKNLWYWLPFVDALDSNELVFTDYRTPFHFPLYDEMRIWYGEDLNDYTESDNSGRVCVKVYARFKL